MGNGTSRDVSIERLDDAIASFRDPKLIAAAEMTALDALGGGIIFFGGVSLTQLAMYVSRVSASTPIVPTVVGAVGVTASSILVGAFCLRSREPWASSESILDYLREVPAKLFFMDPTPVQMTAAAATGLLLFRLLGGRFHAIAPSDFRHPGAFAHSRISLPATLEYADGSARAVIQSLGRLYGCHTCGVRKATSKFHADHQPPVMVAKADNARLWNRLIAGPVVQRYYPQCDACSNIQGAQVKKNAQKLKLHLMSVRPYHATGLWMVLFGAGGLGGYVAERSSPEPTIMEQVAAKATDVFQPMTLERLREREAELKQERKHEKDARDRDAIDEELASIRQKKARVKALNRS
ncbi:hypothetical protein AC1031_001064 [Aphanomyces cochlioides]|nr:hypothetical protein AC1031_001064 [Aphanomyces cochlioides]